MAMASPAISSILLGLIVELLLLPLLLEPFIAIVVSSRGIDASMTM